MTLHYEFAKSNKQEATEIDNILKHRYCGCIVVEAATVPDTAGLYVGDVQIRKPVDFLNTAPSVALYYQVNHHVRKWRGCERRAGRHFDDVHKPKFRAIRHVDHERS
ncbi:hypothetical protein AAG570_013591 [Ranatra chinensis]|uniref:Uncharacterized protein n=1 Tax=Ranatra chinensis TaxID=642074 RepID=A0ABD0Z0X6_9HEMI